jgi:predicted nucleic-acid-binding Zn-ribbon protein
MKNGTCPKCGSNEVLSNLRVSGNQTYPPHVDIMEPEPPNRPFIWSPKSEQSRFVAYVCGSCGYTEFYAENYTALNEGRKKGYISG